MYSELSARITRAVDALLQRAIAESELRDDVTAAALSQTFNALCFARPPEPGWEAQMRRLLDIFIDGLRVQH